MSQVTGKPRPTATGREPSGDQLTIPLIGRDVELVRLKSCLNQSHLVSVTGLGGVGKTRLAMQAARDLEPTFSAGVYWVQLANVDSLEAWYAAWVHALGLDLSVVNAPTQLVAHLRGRPMLLILDGFERLLDHVAWLTWLVDQVSVDDSPVRWLVLSRESLNIPREVIVELHGLSTQPSAPSIDLTVVKTANNASPTDTPAPQALSPAEELFLYYAERAKPGYILTAAEHPYVRQICRAADGIPLALELAAAWMAQLPTPYIAEQIQQNLDWLTTSSKLTHGPQKSMRAALDYFWGLLSPSEQRCLRKLAVFQEGFDRETAQEITDLSTFFLSALVDRSFLIRQENGRYRLHGMLHQYAEDQLTHYPAEASTIRQRHAHAMYKRLSHINDELQGLHKRDGLQWIESEYRNLQQAMQWAIANHAIDLALHMVQSMCPFWHQRGYFSEGIRWINAILTLTPENTTPPYLQAALARVSLYIASGELATGMTQAQALLPQITDDGVDGHRLRGQCLYLISLAASKRGDYPLAQREAEASVAAAKASGDGRTLASALQMLGKAYETNGGYANAINAYQEALTLYESVQNLGGVAQVFNLLGLTHLANEDLPAAVHVFGQSHTLHMQLGDQVNAAYSSMYLGMAANEQRQFATARQHLESALAVFVSKGAQEATLNTWLMLGHVLLEQNNFEESKVYILKGLEAALTLGVMPCMLSGLYIVARTRLKNGKIHLATEMIGLVLSHAASNSTHIREANALLTQARRMQAHDEVERRLASGRRRNLHQTVREILSSGDIM